MKKLLSKLSGILMICIFISCSDQNQIEENVHQDSSVESNFINESEAIVTAKKFVDAQELFPPCDS